MLYVCNKLQFCLSFYFRMSSSWIDPWSQNKIIYRGRQINANQRIPALKLFQKGQDTQRSTEGYTYQQSFGSDLVLGKQVYLRPWTA